MNQSSVRELADYEPVKAWLLGFNDDTKHNYLRYLKWFCEYTDKDPDQLIDEVRVDRRRIHVKAKEFYHRLATRGISVTARGVGYMAIRSFFNHNDYPLGKAPRRFMSKIQIAPSRLLKPSEVSDMIGCAHQIRSRAIISFLAQSGQRIGLLAALRWGAVRRQIEQGITPVVVEVTSGVENGRNLGANKGGISYRFAFGRECRDYLIQMMSQRKHAGEPVNDESWLFKRQVQWARHPSGKWLPRRVPMAEAGHPMNPHWINWVVVRAAYSAGIQSEKVLGHYSNGKPKTLHEVHAHIFRVFWKHQMREGGVTDPDLLDFMMGHAARYGGTYDRFEAEYIRKEYGKAEPNLTALSRQALPERETSIEVGTKSRIGVDRREQQRVVREAELERYLQQGWRYIATLPSKKIVVENMQSEPQTLQIRDIPASSAED